MHWLEHAFWRHAWNSMNETIETRLVNGVGILGLCNTRLEHAFGFGPNMTDLAWSTLSTEIHTKTSYFQTNISMPIPLLVFNLLDLSWISSSIYAMKYIVWNLHNSYIEHWTTIIFSDCLWKIEAHTHFQSFNFKLKLNCYALHVSVIIVLQLVLNLIAHIHVRQILRSHTKHAYRQLLSFVWIFTVKPAKTSTY